MKFGTIVKLKKPFTQGYLALDAGELLAVAHYSHKYFVKLNTFGSQVLLSELITVKFEEIKSLLEVVGQLKFSPVDISTIKPNATAEAITEIMQNTNKNITLNLKST